MKHEAWEKVCHLLNPEELIWVFKDVLDKAELSSLLRESRLSWLSNRAEGSSEEELAERAARAFRTNPHVARSAAESLDSKTLSLRERMDHQSGREVHEGLLVSEAMINEGRIGGLLWALARDERQEVNEGLDSLRAGLLRLVRVGGLKQTGATSQDLEARERLTGELTAAREETGVLRSRLTQMEAIEEEIKDLRRENEELKHARDGQEKELVRLQAEVLEATSDANLLGRMEREVRRLAFTLDKVEAQVGGAREQSQTDQALLDRLDSWYEDLAAWGQARGESEKDIYSILSEIRDRLAAQPTTPLGEEKGKPSSRSESGKERVALFVDGQNMYFGARRAGGKLDFKRFIEGTMRGRTLVKAVAYLVQGEKDVGGLAGLLRRYGYEVRIKERAPSASTSKRVSWELEIAMDILASLGEVDTVALGSGEEEFASLATLLKGRRIRFEVYAFPEAVSPALKEAADAFYPLGEEMVLRFDRWGWEGPARGEQAGESDHLRHSPQETASSG